MRVLRDTSTFRAERAWGARDIAEIDGATVRLHWTDAPYVWHVNDGPEAFVVQAGRVDMHVREGGSERVEPLGLGDIFIAEEGDEHVAHPVSEARMLVVERKGSV